MFWPSHDYVTQFPGSIYLGSDRNPDTMRPYDYWLVKTAGDYFSAVCVHEAAEYEYGSMPLPRAIDCLRQFVEDSRKLAIKNGAYFDLCYGVWKSHKLALEYCSFYGTLPETFRYEEDLDDDELRHVKR